MKKTIIEVSIVLIGALVLGGLVYHKKTTPQETISACPTDVMVCPDGTTIPRSGAACEFGVCRQELPSYLAPQEVTAATSQEVPLSAKTISPSPLVKTSIFTKTAKSVSSLFKQAEGALGKNVTTGVRETSSVVGANNQTQNNQASAPLTANQNTKLTSGINEKHYVVDKDKIIDQDGTVIYTIPPSNNTSSWVTHIVDAVVVGNVAPVIGAIPVTGLPGKFYLSENSFGNTGACQFSNKIYILDTTTGTKELMYEESSATLSPEDPRACTSEMYLLATENEKLILKYHTINTNSTCDSAWSEPDQTWYLDVTRLDLGMRRYLISPELYAEAQASEAQCRLKYDSTSTPEEIISG